MSETQNGNTNVLDLQDTITKCLAQAEAILSLVGHENNIAELADDVISNSIWSVRDLLEQISTASKHCFEHLQFKNNTQGVKAI